MPRIEVLVIGGGATGVGVARDLALRGVRTMLLERSDFCSGSSGANHGMLHSGARYALSDAQSARDCASENEILRKVAGFCIQDCGGVFVRTALTPEGHKESFLKALKDLGIANQPLSGSELRVREPRLAPEIDEGIAVRDASIDPFALVLANVRSARQAGAEIRNYAEVRSFKLGRGGVEEVLARDATKGETIRIKPELVVNASGASAGHISSMVGLSLPLLVDKGSMLVFDGRLVNGLVNHLRPAADGDVLVPSHSATIAGTTSTQHMRPGKATATKEESKRLLHEAALLVPAVKEARMVRAFAGLRHLRSDSGLGRGASRSHQVIDHRDQGIDNMVSLTGGKLTTYRLMAERCADLVCQKLGVRSRGITAREPLGPSPDLGQFPRLSSWSRLRMSSRYGPLATEVAKHCLRSERGLEVACSCEYVLRGELDFFAKDEDVRGLDDLMRRTRAGMGYCQGGLCVMKLASVLHERKKCDAREVIGTFLEERAKGIEMVLEGPQLRQEVLKMYLLAGTYGLRKQGGEG